MFRFQRRHLAEMPAFDLLAEHEGNAAGPVIGARPVVVDTTAELGEQQHDHVIGFVVLAQIGHERVDTLGHRLPQIAVPGVLAGMRVEGAVIAVEHPAANLGDVRLSDALEFAGNRSVGVLDRRGVLLWRDLDDVLALQRVDRGLAEIIHHRAAADCRAVHLGKAIEHLGTFGALHLRQETVSFQGTGHAGHRHAGAYQRAWQAWPHADDLDDVFLLRVEFAGTPAEPAFGPDLFRFAGVPDVHRPEMRARRVLEADAVQDGELAFIPELLHRRYVIRDAVILIEMDDIVITDPDRRP